MTNPRLRVHHYLRANYAVPVIDPQPVKRLSGLLHWEGLWEGLSVNRSKRTQTDANGLGQKGQTGNQKQPNTTRRKGSDRTAKLLFGGSNPPGASRTSLAVVRLCAF